MDLRQYLSAIRKFWWVIVAGGVLGASLGVYTLANAETVYQGSVTFFVKTTGEGNAAAAAQADQFAQRRVNSYAVLLQSDRLARAVLEETDLVYTPKKISKMIGATGGIDTVLLTAMVTAPTEAEALAISQAVAVRFPQLVAEVESQGIGETSVLLEVVSGPTVKALPPRKSFVLGSRTAIGLLLGVAAAVALKLRDTAVSGVDEVEELGLGPVLATIPMTKGVADAPLILRGESHSQRAEAFRQLRTNLQFLDAERPLGTLVVTSAVAGEGKSVSAANLALSLVAAGARVLLVEADLRRPGLSELFGLERSAGLTDVLVSRVDFDDVVQPWGSGGLSVLPTGRLPPNPSELLGSAAMDALLKVARDNYDVVVLDTPPVLPVADALILATKCDGVVLVARTGKTSRHELLRAHNSLGSVSARILGVLLTFVPAKKAYGYTPYGQTDDEPVDEPVPWARHASQAGGSNGARSARSAAAEPESSPADPVVR